MKEGTKIWLKVAKRDFSDYKYNLKGKRYNASIFFCHQATEKIIKALITERSSNKVPRIHDLSKLTSVSKIDLDLLDIDSKELKSFTNLYFTSRYPDIGILRYNTSKIKEYFRHAEKFTYG